MKVFPQWCKSLNLKQVTSTSYVQTSMKGYKKCENSRKTWQHQKNTIIFQKINHKELEISELPNKEFT